MKAKEVMRKDFVKVDRSQTISKLIGKLKIKKQDSALVFDNKKLLGIVTKRGMLKSKLLSDSEQIKNLIWHVPHIDPDTDIIDVATLMFHSGARILPVMQKDKLAGVVKSSDVVGLIPKIKELKGMKISDIRHPRAKKIKESDRLGKVIEIFFEEDISRLPVVDASSKLVGMVSLIDIMEYYFSQPISRDKGSKPIQGHLQTKAYKPNNPNLMDLPVKDFVRRPDVFTADESTTLARAAKTMVKNRISSVVISKMDEPKSMVTKRDLLEAMMNTKKQVIKNIQMVGLNELEELTPQMKAYVTKLCAFYAEKIAFLISGYNTIHVHFKKYKKAGTSHKYSINVKVECPTSVIAGNRASDWDIARTVHKAFKDVEKRIIHRFHSDTTRDKPYE
ncbi:CBS domain-containing protein [Candidatus Woesearchaeota archaeon]|nr:CBS domain-containing protein [Candidatus Woesearchaeota archaeon]